MKAAAVTAQAKLAQKKAAKIAAKQAKLDAAKKGIKNTPNFTAKTKPILSKVPASVKKRAEKGKTSGGAKTSTSTSLSLDDSDLPVLSPQMTLPSADVVEAVAVAVVIAPVIAPPPPVKKGIRRNKFKSGFDYIRKKKKIVPASNKLNPDGSPVPPTPKKVKVRSLTFVNE
jgi:hypothetical protein